jgi:transcriptional regulator with XRE-family HTH domain
MVLLRHLLGDALRRLRLRQGRTLRDVSAAARVSLGYLSEVERGQKEASSELLASICGALDTPLSQVLREVSDNFALAELQNEPVLTRAREPGADGHRVPEPVRAGAGAGAGRARAPVILPARPRIPVPAEPPVGKVPVAPGKPVAGTRHAMLDAPVLDVGQPVFGQLPGRISDIADMIGVG